MQKWPRTAHPGARNELRVLVGRRAENVKNQMQLVQVILAGEQRPPPENLSHDAPDRPYINCAESQKG